MTQKCVVLNEVKSDICMDKKMRIHSPIIKLRNWGYEKES